MAGKRRGNQDGTIRERANGLWEARLSADGRRKSLYAPTRQEAERMLRLAQAERDKGLPVLIGKSPTVAAFLEIWLEVKRATKSYRTWKGYHELVHNHLIPAFGKLTLEKLTPPRIQSLYTEKLRAGLSSTTVKHIHACLHAALHHAMRQGLVSRNPADSVEAPGVAHVDRLILTADEAKHFLATAKGDRWEAAYVLALTIGLREGEVLGLRWRFVDLEAGVLTVAGNVQPGQHGLTLKEPKNDSSIRRIKLPAMAVEALRQHRARQVVEMAEMGELWQHRDLVFPTSDGYMMRCQTFLRGCYKPMLAKAGVPPVRFHDLRHSAASLLIASGVPLKIVSEILGHSTIAVTANLYSHVSLSMQQSAADNMDRMLGA